MPNTLIIKRTVDDFDAFVCKELAHSIPGIEIKDAFILKNKIGRKIINKIKVQSNDILFERFLSFNRSEILKFNTVILFDDYPDFHLIKWIKKYNQNCNIKLWFWNVPNYSIDKYREFCEMYCFDQFYSKKNNIHFINQFYFENLIEKQNDTCIKYDISYVGIDKNRRLVLTEFAMQLNKLKINYNFNLITHNSNIDDKINFLKNPMPYSEIIHLCLESKAVLELVHVDQKGLTWRALEALFFSKKLITNNKDIVNFDFYNKNNIFIYGVDSLERLDDFINSPFVQIPEDIIQNYTIEHWFESIMI